MNTPNHIKTLIAASTLALTMPPLEAAKLPDAPIPEAATKVSQTTPETQTIKRSELNKLIGYFQIAERFCRDDLSDPAFKEHHLIKKVNDTRKDYDAANQQYKTTRGDVTLPKVALDSLKELQSSYQAVEKELFNIRQLTRQSALSARSDEIFKLPAIVSALIRQGQNFLTTTITQWNSGDSKWRENSAFAMNSFNEAKDILGCYRTANTALEEFEGFKLDPKEGLARSHNKRLATYRDDCRAVINAIDKATPETPSFFKDLPTEVRDAPYLLTTEINKLQEDPVYRETSLAAGRNERGFGLIYKVATWGGALIAALGIGWAIILSWSRRVAASYAEGVKRHGRELTKDEQNKVGAGWQG